MRRFIFLVLVCVVFTAGGALYAQAPASPLDEAAKNAAKARVVLDKMVQALGGRAWLDIKNREQHGHIASFYRGNPDPGTTEVFEFHSWPDHDRLDVTKHRDYLQFYIGREAWEVTYRGKKPIAEEQLNEYLRRRDHSVETAVKIWLKDPNTILLYEGQRLAERHLAEQVTLIAANNEAVTILCDASTYLPLSRKYEWRDPVYKDKNIDIEEYDAYHTMQGFPTPFTVTRLKNGEMVRQFFIDKVTYNEDLPPDFWSVDAAEKRIKK